jgi:hypothetical protein
LLHALQEEKTGVLVLEGPELLGDIEATLLHTDLPLLVSCPGDFVIGAPPPTARLTLDLADWLGLSRVDYCFHYHRDSSLVRQNPMHASQTWGEDTTMKIPLAIMGSARGV